MEGVGRYLTTKEVEAFVDGLVRLTIYPRATGDLAQPAKLRMTAEASRTSRKIDPQIRKRLDAWVNLFDGKADDARAQIVRELDSAYDFPDT
jgi:hypothetical protein